MDVDLAKRHVAHELQAHHDHPRHPEEDDVEAGDQYAGGIEGLERLGVLRPAEGRERPQRRGEPGVQHVGILLQRHLRAQSVLGADLRLVAADVDLAFGVVPGRDAVPPPDLPADAPILDAVQPVEIGLFPVFRDELDLTGLDRGDGGTGQRSSFHIPLIGQQRLDHGMAAVAARHHQLVRPGLFQQSLFFQIADDVPTSLEAVQTAIGFGGVVVDAGAGREDVDQRQVMTLADRVVVEVVGRSDLDAAGAEGRVHVLVGDDGNIASGQR